MSLSAMSSSGSASPDTAHGADALAEKAAVASSADSAADASRSNLGAAVVTNSLPSARLRLFGAGVLFFLSMVTVVAMAAEPGEQPSKLIAVLCASLGALVLIFEVVRALTQRSTLVSPFSILPMLGVAAICAASFVNIFSVADGALPPLLAAAPTLAAATMLLGNAWALRAAQLFRGDADILFPKVRGQTEIRLGDLQEYKTGDVIAVDGRIQQGCLALDERHFSPVSVFRIREEEEIVFAGSQVVAGQASVIALTTLADASLSRLQSAVAPMAEAAQSSLSAEDLRASRWSALGIIFLAVAAGIFWHERSPGYAQALLAGGTVALFGSVCLLSELLYGFRRALVQRWLQRGYLLTSPHSCKQLAAIQAVECDSSRCGDGSLLKVTGLDVLDDRLSKEALCNFLCSLVGRAEDPALVAVGEYCRRNGRVPSVERVVDLREYIGRGVCGVVHGVELSIGTEDFLVERGIMVQPSDGAATATNEHLVLAAIDDDVVARLRLTHDQSAVVAPECPNEWEGGVKVAVAPGVARTLGDDTLLVRGGESDLVGQMASRDVTLFNAEDGSVRRSTVVAFTPELAPLEQLLSESRVDVRTVDRFRLMVGFGGLMVLATTFAGVVTPLVPLAVLASVGAVVNLSHRGSIVSAKS
ncbi:MAG: hypothetical protein ACK5GN_14705 [Pseudomonadota bacterium]